VIDITSGGAERPLRVASGAGSPLAPARIAMPTPTPLLFTRRTAGVFLLLVGLAAPVPLASDAAVSVDVRPSVIHAGGSVRTTVRAPRDPHNRVLRIVLEAADFYASSDLQLDGTNAPAIYQFDWQTLPSGSYRVEAILIRDAGEERRAQRCLAVLSMGSPDDGGAIRASRRTPASATDESGC
jgi:hypothetical protein